MAAGPPTIVAGTKHHVAEAITFNSEEGLQAFLDYPGYAEARAIREGCTTNYEIALVPIPGA